MMVIVYKETLEQKWRREYNTPRQVKTEDIWSYIGEIEAKRVIKDAIRKVKEK